MEIHIHLCFFRYGLRNSCKSKDEINTIIILLPTIRANIRVDVWNTRKHCGAYQRYISGLLLLLFLFYSDFAENRKVLQ